MRAVRIDAIQIARMLAAALVVFDHALVNLMSDGTLDENYPFAFRSGGFGVVVFFLISGFVMSHSMFDSFGQAGVWKTFLQRRLLRITPLYWLVTLAIAGKAFLLSTLDDATPVLLSMAYIPYRPEPGAEVQPLNGVGWTLNYEMLFYVIFALCLCFSRRIGAILLSSVLIGLVLLHDGLTASIGSNFWSTAVGFWTDQILLYFLAGAWLGLLRARLDRARGCPHVGNGLILSVLLITILTYEYLLYREMMPRWLEATFAISIMAGLGLTNSSGEGRVTRVLKVLGDASYSTYLTHLFFLSALWKVARPSLTSMDWMMYLVIALIGANVAGYFVYILIEKPMLKKAQAWFSRPPQLAAQRDPG